MLTQQLSADAHPTHAPVRRVAKSWQSKLGWGLTLLPCLAVLASGVSKIGGPPSEQIVQGMGHLGIDVGFTKFLGILEILVALVCIVPRASFIGAILFTGWAGGAIFAHLRVGDPFYAQILLPVVLWVGIGLRHRPEIASLLGLRGAPPAARR